ncbi:MAG: ferrous iron transport protein B [Verrucomicrobia bacterium]|nr:ferrous iron transport protein B [Verrucomicrobiota bacterium]
MLPVAPAPAQDKTATFALVGNPNCGKSTLFNALTGMRQKVGNYPGVTVEKKVGELFSLHGRPMQIIDLPGAYSLSPRSPDEAITRDVLLGRISDTSRPDKIICVVDASNLERNLFLVTQVLDLGVPTVLALNMMDLAHDKGISLNPEELSRELGIPVVACQAHKKIGITELRQAMSRTDLPVPVRRWRIPELLEDAVEELCQALAGENRSEPKQEFARALILLAGENASSHSAFGSESQKLAQRFRLQLEAQGIDWHEAVVAARYQYAQGVCEQAVRSGGNAGEDHSDRLDAVLTHPIWGWAVFLGLMAFMFFSIFTLATYPMDWVEGGFTRLANAVKQAMPPGDLRDLMTDGVVAGVGGVLVFLPQILILFFFIGLLEDTGYMARAAFIMDRVMSRVGLHGKSFIPLLSSYACAIPGIMAARTIENPKDRLVTILVAPLMSCSARLPVYTLMIATLLPAKTVPALQKAGIMMALYVVGTATAFFFAWLFKRTIMHGETPVLIMELPPYRLPSMASVVMQMINRSKLFVKRAGTVILGLSIILWFLAAYPKAEGGQASSQLAHSFAGKLGHAIEPIIKPLGFDWKIGIGLIGSFAAREVFVSTMSVVYNVEEASDVTLPLRDAMLREKWADGTPVFTPLACVTLMVFYVLALQCISTVAVVKRETNSWHWPLFQLAYMTGTAYVACLIVYQTGKVMGFQ